MSGVDPVRLQIYNNAIENLLKYLETQTSFIVTMVKNIIRTMTFETMMVQYLPYKEMTQDQRINAVFSKMGIPSATEEDKSILKNIDNLFSICFS
jgi:hypothetical protein